MAGYISLFDLGESKDDVEVDYASLHHFRVGPGSCVVVTLDIRSLVHNKLSSYGIPEITAHLWCSSPFKGCSAHVGMVNVRLCHSRFKKYFVKHSLHVDASTMGAPLTMAEKDKGQVIPPNIASKDGLKALSTIV